LALAPAAAAQSKKGSITEADVNAAQQAWCDGLVKIGKVHKDGGDYRAVARRLIDDVSMGGMVQSFRMPPTTVGTAIVLYSLGVSGFIMVGAKLGQRFGSKAFFRATVGLFGAAMVLMTISWTAGTMLAAQGLAGLACAALVPTLVVLIASPYQGKQQAQVWIGGGPVVVGPAWGRPAYVVGPAWGPPVYPVERARYLRPPRFDRRGWYRAGWYGGVWGPRDVRVAGRRW
jgi:MFS family permease